MKQLRMAQTSPDHPQTSLTEKRNTKSNESSHTDNSDNQNDFNISSNGRDIPKATTHGNQLTKSTPLNLSNIINPQDDISHLQPTITYKNPSYKPSILYRMPNDLPHFPIKRLPKDFPIEELTPLKCSKYDFDPSEPRSHSIFRFRYKLGRKKLRDNWIVGFLVVKTGDSTCHPRDSKEGYLYRTILGFY